MRKNHFDLLRLDSPATCRFIWQETVLKLLISLGWKKKGLFIIFLIEYSWTIKFQFHFEMCPGRMCHKCQRIQHHELKMISACYSVLLQ